MRRQRPVGQIQFGGRYRVLDEADQPVGGCDDDAGAGGWHSGWVAEERGIGTRRQQTGAAQPSIAAARRGDRETCADERQAGGVHRGDGGSRQGQQSRGA